MLVRSLVSIVRSLLPVVHGLMPVNGHWLFYYGVCRILHCISHLSFSRHRALRCKSAPARIRPLAGFSLQSRTQKKLLRMTCDSMREPKGQCKILYTSSFSNSPSSAETFPTPFDRISVSRRSEMICTTLPAE